MLKRVRLKDFKSFVDEEVELAPLTLLVGANAAGKSNFLDAIRFLKGLVSGLTLSEILNGEKRSGPDTWPGIRGRTEEAARAGTDVFSVETTWMESNSSQMPLCHQLSCRIAPGVRLEYESLSSEGEPQPWLTTTSSHVLNHITVNQVGGAPLVLSDKYSLLNLFKSGPLADLLEPGYPALGRLANSILDLQFLNIDPAVMRDYGRRGDPLREDGHNLSGVLADLCQGPDDKQALVHWLTELCAPEIEDLDFIEVQELGDVMAMFVEKGGKRISARSVSDGTLHFLGTLLALRTAEPGSVILIEEIETGLHPTRIRLLVEYLETVTRERNIQVIATTHSPVVLQWLSDESLHNTVVFGRVPEHEGTIMRRLGDLPHFEEVIQKKGIEELFSTGWLEMAL